MARLRNNISRQHQRLYHLDASPFANQRSVDLVEWYLGQGREGDFCCGRWFFEWVLHLPCPVEAHRKRVDEICAFISDEPGAHLSISIVRCKSCKTRRFHR